MAKKGANNGRPLDPRQVKMLTLYLDPKSDTFANALKSALGAGFSKEYAENITGQMPKWLSESLGDHYLIEKAEKNLKDLLDSDKENIKLDATKFVSERLNRAKYAKRIEHTGANGGPIEMKDLTQMTDEELLQAASEG